MGVAACRLAAIQTLVISIRQGESGTGKLMAEGTPPTFTFIFIFLVPFTEYALFRQTFFTRKVRQARRESQHGALKHCHHRIACLAIDTHSQMKYLFTLDNSQLC